VAGASKGGSISEENALRAAGWCSYLETHVLRVYYPLLDTPGRRAQTLLHHLQMGDIKHGSKTREIWRKEYSGLNSSENLREALEITIKPTGGGRPSERLHLHPDLRD
jgi:hypothetical protein